VNLKNMVEGDNILQVKEFKFVGSVEIANDDCTKEILRRELQW